MSNIDLYKDKFVIKYSKLPKTNKTRYVIIQEHKIIDNGRGYGYKTISNAWKSHIYKLTRGKNA